MASVAVVLGSIRPGRAGEQVVRWIEEQSLQIEGVTPIFIDLRDYNLPLFAEEMPPSMQAPTLPEAVRLLTNIDALDAVVFVTPEYNHSISGFLKNAIDYLPPATLRTRRRLWSATPTTAASPRARTCARFSPPSVPTSAIRRSALTLVLTSSTAPSRRRMS